MDDDPPRRGLHGDGRYSRRLVGRIPDRRGSGGGSDSAEARLARDLRFVYAAVRSPAPCWRGVLMVREDRSSPRGVHPCSAPIHQIQWREDEVTVACLYEAYREARRPLQQAIKEAKRRA